MKANIGVIGLGYVGLPLSLEFGKFFTTIGFDIDQNRIKDLKNYKDKNAEVGRDSFNKSKNLSFTSNLSDIENCNIYIITVPTPKNKLKKPDLRPLKNASKMIGPYIKNQDIIIFESTVYPGVTEEVCVPILEKSSGIKFIYKDDKLKKGFYCGYSPERINPGDKHNHFTQIVKILAGSTPKSTNRINKLYSKIIKAGTYPVSSIRIAESVKVVENVQRDINISLMNELSIIFNKLNLDFNEILNAAETKWNFSSYKPGLVGGHCIGVDPYYLIHKSKKVGYNPKFIESARILNDNMAHYVAKQTLKLISNKNPKYSKPNILIMGFSYKEDCPDIRNTLVFEIYKDLKNTYNAKVDIYDPVVSSNEVLDDYGIRLIKSLSQNKKYDAVIIAVKHSIFRKYNFDTIKNIMKKNGVLYDLKQLFPKNLIDGSL